ncbi:pseudouridylate synthase 7 homolog-like protein isoform X1 [Ochotona curzoniae]|uniref:pseudouridylate synthase 7 homolog-like protein isoform X1 n=2 Tax=Ochotona curzoniae TaxID=130825 RepID=UPI001B34C564|nr:pseudouridylate synthase 7 homolog-like protein isoform X1 [Ochotona curzoniae]
MEEDAGDRSWRDSLCFMSDHIGFCGSIRSSPSDFVVTELDEQGRLVTKPLDELTSKSHVVEPDNLAKRPKLDLQNVSGDEGSSQGANAAARCPDADPRGSDRSPGDQEGPLSGRTCKTEEDAADVISSFLDEKTNEQLSEFALELKEKWNSGTELVESSPEFPLAKTCNKNQRAALHTAVRQKFPFLITLIKDSAIVVKPNLRYKELCHLVSEEEAAGFFTYLNAKEENSTFSFKPDTNKERRRAVHLFVHKRFGGLVESKSFPELGGSARDPKVVVTVRFRDRAHKARKGSLGQWAEVAHTAFTLRKENVEMFEAIDFLAAKLGVTPADFSYAGLKDKKAVTYQAMVVRKVTPERFKDIEKIVENKRMNVFNVRPASEALRLGQLQGNHFDIVVRDVRSQPGDSAPVAERVLEAIETVKNKGFVNYYGPQRFGKGKKVHTDQIGLALLKNEMVKSVKLFLTPEDVDDPVNRAKRYFLETEDAKGTLAMMPEFKVRERALLESLRRFGLTEEGCKDVWFCLPYAMRMFYVHAYSSQVWNEAVSYRLGAYGSRVVAGDLVRVGHAPDEREQSDTSVHLVTKEEELANTYTIHQVVLPVPGYNVQYPENLVGRWYQELLSRDGLQTCSFRLPALALKVPGCYRHIVKQPHSVVHQLLEDQGSAVRAEGTASGGAPLSLKISFDLDASCYATVCLWEMMKHEG